MAATQVTAISLVACSQSANGFGGKVGNGFGAAVVGWCLAIAHYDATSFPSGITCASLSGIWISNGKIGFLKLLNFLPIALWRH